MDVDNDSRKNPRGLIHELGQTEVVQRSIRHSHCHTEKDLMAAMFLMTTSAISIRPSVEIVDSLRSFNLGDRVYFIDLGQQEKISN